MHTQSKKAHKNYSGFDYKIIESGVLVVGAGGAGLRAAIELRDLGADVLVVGKSKKRDAHTILATGGINAALSNMDKADSWQLHAADTIRDGGMINDPIAVKVLCQNAPGAVNELSKWGAKFHRENDGRISQRFFGAATFRRACFAGDHTGKEILNTLVDQAVKRKIRFQSEVYIFSLLLHKGKVNGAIGFEINTGKILVFHSKIVVLATGGFSRIFSRSSSRDFEGNGDGIKLAFDVGAKFADMELFQFHPTGMVWPKKAEGILVTEAVRGEGGHLLNKLGERFMKNYDAARLELSARDVVSRAVYTEVKEGRGTKNGGVWLDISFKPKKIILERLPKMFSQFKSFAGIDISKEKMEVSPTAHYSMGGILVDNLTGKTSVPNLFAIGEVTSGVHGANRLGGNSLAEIIVFGRLTGKSVFNSLSKTALLPLDESFVEKKLLWLSSLLETKKGESPLNAKKGLQDLMWETAGVVRDGKGLNNGLSKLSHFKKMKFVVGKSLKKNDRLLAALDFYAMLPTCEMVLKSALFRRESRGAHCRSDYPKASEKWRKNIVCSPSKNEVKLSAKKVSPVPKEISAFLAKKPSHSNKLLE